MKNYLNDTTLSKTTDYIGNAIYEDDSLSLFGTAEGRVIKNPYSGDLEYEYALSDHTGNTRVVFNATAKSDTYEATFEDATVAQDTTYFYNIGTRTTYIPNNKGVGLNNTNPFGPSIGMNVYPGDTISMSVKAFYVDNSGHGTTPLNLSAMTALISGAFGTGGAGIESQVVYDLFDAGASAAVALLGGSSGTDTVPSAYLNYLLFDATGKELNSGFFGVQAGANLVQTISATDLVIDEPGFIYVYVTNESNSTKKVYFDNFKVTQSEGRVTQSTDYYPFGLQTADSWTRTWSTPNKHLYNGASELNEDTKYYETFYRNYDASIGRFMSVDPLASRFSSWTPYQYAYNDPIYWNDPNGDCSNCYTTHDGTVLNFYALDVDGFGGGGYQERGYYGYRYTYGGGFTGGTLAEIHSRTRIKTAQQELLEAITREINGEVYILDPTGTEWVPAQEVVNETNPNQNQAYRKKAQAALDAANEKESRSNGGTGNNETEDSDPWYSPLIGWLPQKFGFSLMGDGAGNETLGNKVKNWNIIQGFRLNYPGSAPPNVYEAAKNWAQAAESFFEGFSLGSSSKKAKNEPDSIFFMFGDGIFLPNQDSVIRLDHGIKFHKDANLNDLLQQRLMNKLDSLGY